MVIEEGAVIERTIIRGPAIIGARARLTHAYVGPYTSIMNDVEIRDSEIEHSIVLEGPGRHRDEGRRQLDRQERQNHARSRQALGLSVHAR